MKKWIFCALFLSACQGAKTPLTLDSQALKQSLGIVGGDVVEEDAPLQQQVFLYDSYVHSAKNKNANQVEKPDDILWSCTTSAVTSRIFLLAAHCIRSDSFKSEVTFPANNGDDITIKVVKSIRHEDYTEKNTSSDLALILLEKDAPKNVQYMRLPNPAFSIYPNKIRAAGFGLTSGIDEASGNNDDDLLRQTNLNVLNFAIDQPRFVVDQSHGHGICQGDSGGPAVVLDNGALYIVGVASETLYDDKKQPLDLCNDQAHYVNVQFYYPWLNKHINELIQIE